MEELEMLMTVNGALAIGLSATNTVATAGCLDGAKVHLLKDTTGLELDGTDDIADLLDVSRECDFDGYTAKTITWSVGTISDTDAVEYLGTVAEFRPTGSTTPNNVKAFVVTKSDASVDYFVGEFEDEGAPMESALDSIRMTPRVRPKGGSLMEVLS